MKRVLFILFLIYPFYLNGQNFSTTNLAFDGKPYRGITIVFSAINASTIFFNVKKLNKYDKYRSNAIFGAISGGAQTAFGFAGLNENKENILVPAIINIGMGLTTLTTSIIRLATKNPPKENDITLNMIFIPEEINSELILGLNLKIKFK